MMKHILCNFHIGYAFLVTLLEVRHCVIQPSSHRFHTSKKLEHPHQHPQIHWLLHISGKFHVLKIRMEIPQYPSMGQPLVIFHLNQRSGCQTFFFCEVQIALSFGRNEDNQLLCQPHWKKIQLSCRSFYRNTLCSRRLSKDSHFSRKHQVWSMTKSRLKVF